MQLIFTIFFGFLLIDGHAQTSLSNVEKREIISGQYQEYFESWAGHLKTSEAIIKNPDTYWATTAMEYWNRFVTYIKMAPDPSNEILVAFMDAYEFDPHDFCDEYTTAKFWDKEGYKYIFEHHKKEMLAMKALCNCTFSSYNTDLIQKLKKIEERDQRVRSQLKDHTLDELRDDGSWGRQLTLDSLNTIEVAKIIDDFGYPGRSTVGIELEAVAFLVIQHSNIDFMEKCLPLIKQAVDKRGLHGKYFGYLYDRIEMIQGRPQLYGTQYDLKGKLWEVVDEKNLNKRRLEIGLYELYPH